MKVKVSKLKIKENNLIELSKENRDKIIDDKANLTYCLTIFITLYNIIKENKEKYPYGVRFCVDEGIELIKKYYPDSSWKDAESLVLEKEKEV